MSDILYYLVITPEGTALQEKAWTSSAETLQSIVDTGIAPTSAIGATA